MQPIIPTRHIWSAAQENPSTQSVSATHSTQILSVGSQTIPRLLHSRSDAHGGGGSTQTLSSQLRPSSQSTSETQSTQ